MRYFILLFPSFLFLLLFHANVVPLSNRRYLLLPSISLRLIFFFSHIPYSQDMIVWVHLSLLPLSRTLMFHRYLTTQRVCQLQFFSFFIVLDLILVLLKPLHVIFKDSTPDHLLVMLETGGVHALPVEVIRLLPALSSLRMLNRLILLLI